MSIPRPITYYFLLGLILFPFTSLAINFNQTSIIGLAGAYGFVLGQDYSLSRIARELPELSGQVALARAQFASIFPGIQTELEAQLKQAMGESLFRETASNIQTNIKATLGRQQITRDIAANFLGQVKARSKGQIESPVFEYLLAVRYSADPVGEFLDGFRQRYRTDGTGKSQGIKLFLQLPRSWVAKEGERPHILQNWVSENGTGLEAIHLDIRDAQGYNPTKEEMEEFVRSGEVQDVALKGSTYINSGSFTVEKQAGYWVQFAMAYERAEIMLYQNALFFQFFFRGKAIGLMCQAGGRADEKIKVNEALQRIRPLCQQVLNSFVLEQVYK